MHELFPIAAGLFLGSLLQFVRPGLRRPLGLTVAVVIGVAATVASGEYRIGWEFLLIDIPLAALATATGFLLTRRARAVARRP